MLALTGTVTLAGIGLGSAGNVLAQETETVTGSEQERTLEWAGQGEENAEQDCDATEQGFWHWILTPGGSTPLVEAGAELTVEFADGTTKTVDGSRRGQGSGALHFEMTKDGGGTVTAAAVTFSGGGNNPVLTISDARCEQKPEEPPEEFEDLMVTPECVHGNGSITVSNSNDVTVSVTVSGPNGYEQEKGVPPGDAIEFGGLENGTYDLETASDDIGLDHSSVEIDY